MVTEAKIKEIFESIQGEGPVVGYKQLFIRFCGCNLHCKYCDTDFNTEKSISYTPQELKDKICMEYNTEKIHSISLTGGEPLLHTEFLKEFLPLIKKDTNIKIYLETNATLTDKLPEIKDNIDIISADIKLSSSSGKDTFKEHKEFINQCKGKETFAKIVFDENITNKEIDECTEIGKENDIELILQPKMNGKHLSITSETCTNIMNKFLNRYKKVRLIPQTHKFLDIQ